MSWFRIVCCLGMILLAACGGYQPVYTGQKTASSSQSALSAVAVARIADRRGQVLRQFLIQKLGMGYEPKHPLYTLEVTLEESINQLGIEQDATASYAKLLMEAEYTLKDSATGKVLLKDKADAASGYRIVDSEFASLKAQNDARAKCLRKLTDVLARDLILYFDK